MCATQQFIVILFVICSKFAKNYPKNMRQMFHGIANHQYIGEKEVNTCELMWTIHFSRNLWSQLWEIFHIQNRYSSPSSAVALDAFVSIYIALNKMRNIPGTGISASHSVQAHCRLDRWPIAWSPSASGVSEFTVGGLTGWRSASCQVLPPSAETRTERMPRPPPLNAYLSGINWECEQPSKAQVPLHSLPYTSIG